MDNTDLKTIWLQIVSKLAEEIGPETSEMWIKPLNPLLFENNRLKIEVPNQMWYETVKQRYESRIIELIKEKTGTDITVEYSIPLGTATLPAQAPIPLNTPENPAPAQNQAVNASSDWNTSLNPNYIFEEFIEAPSNRFAYGSAQAVVKNLGVRKNNPLVIYSKPGLGKTHLLHAIGNEIIKTSSKARVLYMSGESFVNEYIESLQKKTSESFRNKYRTLDCFLVDDIQFVVGKTSSEKEFFYTFNALFDSKKQIVLTSDRNPKELEIEERLGSRLYSGIVVEIKPPDIETRIAILRKKRETYNFNIPDDVIVFIGTMVKSSIRELEGCLIRLDSFCSSHGLQPSVQIAKEVLSDIIKLDDDRPAIDLITIEKIVARAYSIDVSDFKSNKRTDAVSLPRHIAMYFATELTGMSLSEIGKAFDRDHSTVVHARDRIKKMLEEDPFFSEKLNHLETEIRNFSANS